MAVSTSELRRELEELIAALDRRVPQVERAGEVTIAREAAALRAKAVARLAELERRCYRAIPLPEGAIGDSARASFHDGVLEIAMQAAPETTRGRRLEIADGSEDAGKT